MDSTGGYVPSNLSISQKYTIAIVVFIIFNLYFNEVDLKLIQLTLHFSCSPKFHLFPYAITHARTWLTPSGGKTHPSHYTLVLSVYHWDLRHPFNGLFFPACSLLELKVTFKTLTQTLKLPSFSESLILKPLLELTSVHAREITKVYRYLLSTKEEMKSV